MYPQYTNQAYQGMVSNSASLGAVAATGLAGALVGGAVAAAKGAREIKEGKDKSELVRVVAKEALGSGLALAAGAFVAKSLFRSTPLGFVSMLAVSIGAKYVYDGLACSLAEKVCCSCQTEAVAETKPAAGGGKKASA